MIHHIQANMAACDVRRNTPVSDLNQALFLLINAPAAPPHAAIVLATVAAKYLILLVPLHLVLVWVAGDTRLRIIATTSLAALVLALVANQVLGILVPSPRPFVAGIGHSFLAHRPNSSFPSNHATVFFTYAAVLMVFGKDRLAVTVGLLGLLVAWSRVYLGVHYPLDMIGAAVVGAVSATVTVSVMRRCGRLPFTIGERLHAAMLPLLVRAHVVCSPGARG
jgi:undecaprenyl-diphosphatase